jgi:hypothetical protein
MTGCALERMQFQIRADLKEMLEIASGKSIMQMAML